MNEPRRHASAAAAAAAFRGDFDQYGPADVRDRGKNGGAGTGHDTVFTKAHAVASYALRLKVRLRVDDPMIVPPPAAHPPTRA